MEPGILLDHRYRLDARIGAGGMGEVWRARDTRLNRTVAVKTLRTQTDSDARARELAGRFEREAQAAAGLSASEHIVTVHDYGDTSVDGHRVLYLVMQELEGRPLSTRLAEDGPPPLPEVVNWARQMCAGLAAAHAENVVHRDIKPANVMVRADGHVTLLDFGIARFVSDTAADAITRSGSMLGTPSYMSPEQVQGGDVTPASDLYSLGCVLYAMTTGSPPFQADPRAVPYHHVEEQPERPSLRRGSQLPHGWDETVLRLLAKSPADRPDAVELGNQLAALPTRGAPPAPPTASHIPDLHTRPAPDRLPAPQPVREPTESDPAPPAPVDRPRPADEVPVTMPALGSEDPIVVDWLASEGAWVRADEPLVTAEADGVRATVEAPCTGILRKILTPASTTVCPGDDMALIGIIKRRGLFLHERWVLQTAGGLALGCAVAVAFALSWLSGGTGPSALPGGLAAGSAGLLLFWPVARYNPTSTISTDTVFAVGGALTLLTAVLTGLMGIVREGFALDSEFNWVEMVLFLIPLAAVAGSGTTVAGLFAMISVGGALPEQSEGKYDHPQVAFVTLLGGWVTAMVCGTQLVHASASVWETILKTHLTWLLATLWMMLTVPMLLQTARLFHGRP